MIRDLRPVPGEVPRPAPRRPARQTGLIRREPGPACHPGPQRELCRVETTNRRNEANFAEDARTGE